MSDLIKPPILDDTGQTIKTKLTAILQALQNAGNVFIPKTQKGAASGVAELDSSGKVPTGQIPTLSQYMVKGTDYVTAGLQSGETVGNNTTVEGFSNKGRGDYNHIEGSNNGDNLASRNVHIEGEDNAIGGSGQYGLHIEGKGNDGHYAANYAHIGGKYANVDSINGTDWAFLVGNGTADNSRSNAFGVTWDGDAIAGRSNGLGDNRKLVTGADVISYLNSNLGFKYYYNSAKLYDIVKDAKDGVPFVFLAYKIADVESLTGISSIYCTGISWIKTGVSGTTVRTILLYPDGRKQINLHTNVSTQVTSLLGAEGGNISSVKTTGTFQQFCCYKVGNVVCASARHYGLDDAATGHFFTLPEGFRPPITAYGMASIYVNNVSIGTACAIESDGKVKISYSSGQNLSQISFSATFPIL